MKVLLGETHLAQNHDEIQHPAREDLEDDLESDFKKGDTPASWAPGHPVAWGQEEWKFTTGDVNKRVTSVSATSDEIHLAVATGDTIAIFQVDGYKLVSVFKTGGVDIHRIEFAKNRGEVEEYVLACEYGEDYSGRNDYVRIWHLDKDCKEIESANKFMAKGSIPTFVPTAFSYDSKTFLYLTTTRDEWGNHPTITAVDVATGKEKYQMMGHRDSIMWAGFSPNDKFIASAAWDGYLKLYSGEDGKLIRNYGPTGAQNWACAFDPEANNIAVSTGRNTFLWRTDDPRSFPVTLVGKRGWQRVISYSPDGKKLAIGAAEGRLVVYDTKAMTLAQLWQLSQKDGSTRWLKEVTVIEWLGSGKRICWKPSDGSLQMYDFESNLKWKWGTGNEDKWRSGMWFNTVIVLEETGLIGSLDQDGAFRMWEIPQN